MILLASLRFVGVSSGELSAPDAFAAFAVAFWAGAVIPITGSGLGVVDAVLITMLIESSTASDDALVAAALLWRVFYSVAILPLGAITFESFPPRRRDRRGAGRVVALTGLARPPSPHPRGHAGTLGARESRRVADRRRQTSWRKPCGGESPAARSCTSFSCSRSG